jgi:eukaryotic-like serine/threonine-protein kinase
MQKRTDRIKTLASHSRFRVGALLVQPDRLIVSLDGNEISLEPRVMEVLVALAEHVGEVISAEQLLIEVWHGTFYGDNPVHKAIAQLRRLIGDDSRAPRYIETIRKRGYRLIAKVAFPDEYRRAAIQSPAWPDRSPYVGLSAFDGEHADVFFGRSRMTADLMAAMRSQIDSQRRFVLIIGASGCGKTSLLRAGVIPLLQQDGGFDGLRALSVAHCDLTAAEGGDVLKHLASALGVWALGERPVFPPQPVEHLAQTFAQRPDAIAGTIADAFQRCPSREIAEQPHAHLLLVIDHAEALVASSHIDHDERMTFSRALDALCDSPRTLVAMIARSDFYPKLMEAMPAIAERKAGDGHLDILAPRTGEIAQIIRLPAMLAGLNFEEHRQTALRLDDVLRDAAAQHLDALPLLQHTLQSLYERRDDTRTLGFDAYRDIGGLEGALAHRAEEVFAALPTDAQTQLDAVLAQLIVIQSDSDAVSARWVRWSSLQNQHAQTLAEAFVRARLFVGELRDGRPGFGVAHEALLRQWPRAQEWGQDNRRLLHARARLQRAAARWVEEGRRDDHLLNPGRPLNEGLEAAQKTPDELSVDEHGLLRASQRQSRRKRALRIFAIAMLAVLSLVSSALAVLAVHAQREEQQRREEALQLADYMLVDLAEKLRPLGNLKLLNGIGAEALSYLERRPADNMRAEDLVNHSRALRTVGEVMMAQAKLDDAKVAFVRADAVARQAVSLAPESTQSLAESGIAAYWLGYYHYRQARLDDARIHWTTYRDTSERLLRIDPQHIAWQVELSYALNNLGTLARDQGHTDEAVSHFKRSAALKQRALADKPNDTALRYELIDTLSWISSGDESQGRLAEAASGYAAQIRMLRTLIEAAPEARAWERRLATSLLRSALLSVARGQLEDAYTQINESVERLSALTRQEPDNRVWRRDLAHAQMEAADIARLRGDSTRASVLLRSARALIETLVVGVDVQPEWQRLHALIRLHSSQLEPIASRRDAVVDSAIIDLQQLVVQAPNDIAGRAVLTQALIARGIRRRQTDHFVQANSDWQEAAAQLQAIAPASQDPRVLAPWVMAHLMLGKSEAVERNIRRLDEIGYRHPEFVAVRQQYVTRAMPSQHHD